MQTTIFYIFQPTVSLLNLATAHDQIFLAQPAVWQVIEHDRFGAQYSGEDLSRAHLLQFLANLVGGVDEPSDLADFRSKCVALGFRGCWNVYMTKVGGNAKDLIDEGLNAEEFLKKHGPTT